MASVESAPQPTARQRAAHRADPEGAEQQSVGQRPPRHEVARDQRHQGRDGRSARPEHRPAQQNGPEARRHRDVAQPVGHRERDALAGQGARARLGPPAPKHRDEGQVAPGVGREGAGRAGGRHDRAADRGPHRARCVEAHQVQRDRPRQGRTRDHVPHRRLPGGVVEGGAAADREGEAQQQPRRQHPSPGAGREPGQDGEHKDLRAQHDDAPVEVVRHRPREQRQHHDRQHGGGLHQSHLLLRARQLRHQP